MALICQLDSYCKEYSTKVLSCDEVVKASSTATIKQVDVQRNSSVGTPNYSYEVILDNTILFPEGGGQPDDRGTIDEIPVLKVSKRGLQAVHLVDAPVQVGTTVKVTVDWERRFDHMQQHTGQHLITAIAESIYGFKTTSWYLGERNSFVELETPEITAQQMEHIELDCNAKIRDHLPVNVTLHEHLSSHVRSRLLPDARFGPIRVVSIQGIDENTCCGTHVSNLSHLQIVKIMYVEKGKKNKSNLFFLVGDRVLRFAAECVQKDRQLTASLNGGPDRHVALVDKIQKALRISQKKEMTLMRDLASLEARRFNAIYPRPKLLSLYRHEGNADFMNIIVKEIKDEEVLLFLTVGEEKGAGQLLLSGKPALVAELGPKVLEILEGKGSTKGNRLNGKVTDLSKRSKAEQFLRQALNIE